MPRASGGVEVEGARSVRWLPHTTTGSLTPTQSECIANLTKPRANVSRTCQLDCISDLSTEEIGSLPCQLKRYDR